MGHYINDGEDFFAVVSKELGRSEPWHRLGHYAEKALTAEEALTVTNMNFEVFTRPLFVPHGDDAVMVPGKNAVCYVSPKTGEVEVLGIVGNRRVNLSPVDYFRFMDGIVGNVGGAHFDTAGFLRPVKEDGTQMAQIFCTIDLGDAGNVVLDPNGSADPLKTKLFCTAGLDGSMAIHTGMTCIRIVCANTQQMALGDTVLKIRHTASVSERMAQAQEALGLTLKYQEEVVKAAERLVQQAYTDREFGKLMKQVFPAPGADRDKEPRRWANAEKAWDATWYLWKEGPANENIRGTRWAALQSVGEYLDWYRPTRGDDPGQSRAVASVTGGTVAAIKQRAFALLSQ